MIKRGDVTLVLKYSEEDVALHPASSDYRRRIVLVLPPRRNEALTTWGLHATYPERAENESAGARR